VKLINTDGLALIGPGSEWFWTALSGLILAVTFVAIYRQLRLQRNAAALEHLNSLELEWGSERMARAYLAVLLAIQAGTDPADFPEGPVSTMGDFWAKVAYRVDVGGLDVRLLHSMLSPQIQVTWARLQPTVLALRQHGGLPDAYRDFEDLAARMARMDVKHNRSAPTDPDALSARLPGLIAQARDLIEIDVALRTVPVQLAAVPLPVTVVREAA
jgi:hypothetical protein